MPEEMKLHKAPALSDFSGQGALYDGLMHTLESDTYVHAYLISGIEGVGKRTLAGLLAQFMLCGAEKRPCGVCPSCIQVQQGNHPDVIHVIPGKPISPDVKPGLHGIPVDEIRHVNSLVGQHTFTGGRRVVIIERAHMMNGNAQNALLKTLEEPLAGTVFLLLTDSPDLLLPTIISRCRALKLHPWPDDYILRVLQEHGVADPMARQALHVCGGSIGRALETAGDEAYWQRRQSVISDFFALQGRSEVLRVSGAWRERKDEADELLNDLEDMIRTLMLVRLNRTDDSMIDAFPPAWQRMAHEAGLEAFLSLQDAVRDARRLRGNQVTWQAVVEKLLLRLMEERSKWST